MYNLLSPCTTFLRCGPRSALRQSARQKISLNSLLFFPNKKDHDAKKRGLSVVSTMSRYRLNPTTMRMEEVPVDGVELEHPEVFEAKRRERERADEEATEPSTVTRREDKKSGPTSAALSEARNILAADAEQLVGSAQASAAAAYDYCSGIIGYGRADKEVKWKDPTQFITKPSREESRSHRDSYANKYGLSERPPPRDYAPRRDLEPEPKKTFEGSWLDELYQTDPSDLWELIPPLT